MKRLLLLVSVSILSAVPFVNLNGFQNNPKPPAGAFPKQVGDLKLTDEIISTSEPAYTKHRAQYKLGNDLIDDIEYVLKVYPSPKDADAALRADYDAADDRANERRKRGAIAEGVYMKNVTNKSKEKITEALLRTTVRQEGNGTVGYCTMEYAKGSNIVVLTGSFSCEHVEKFLIELFRNTP
jgi:hypothetical protein